MLTAIWSGPSEGVEPAYRQRDRALRKTRPIADGSKIRFWREHLSDTKRAPCTLEFKMKVVRLVRLVRGGQVAMASGGLDGDHRVWKMRQERRKPEHTTCIKDMAIPCA